MASLSAEKCGLRQVWQVVRYLCSWKLKYKRQVRCVAVDRKVGSRRQRNRNAE